MFIDFLKKKNAIAFLEIALILPIFLILVMGIIEFSIIFSIRSGLEEISRDLARATTSENIGITGGLDTSSIASIDTYKKKLIYRIHTKATNIVLKPQNLRLCIVVRTTLVNITAVNANTPPPANCVNFSSNRAIQPGLAFNIVSGNYALVRLSYRHEYLTPLGRLIAALGNDLTFATIAYFRKD
jgi:hypothetical protein